MCTRPTPSYRSVSASAGALGVSIVGAFHAMALLLLALVTAPIRHSINHRQHRPLAGIDVQVHLGDSGCVSELESIIWNTLRRAQQTWAPLPLPLDRVVVGAGFPATGRADIYDDFLELADGSATTSSGQRRRVVVSLGVRDGTRDLDGWEIAGALAAQIQVLVDDHCRKHRSLGAPAAAVAQVTTRLARPATSDGHLIDAIARDEHPAQSVAGPAATPIDVPVAEEVPSLAELLATVQKGQPLVAAGPSSNGTHP
jgi:hypothetical protein